MGLKVLIGGVRSGKSDLAVRWGSSWSGPVAVIATAEARDPEMALKIEKHRANRPQSWQTIEQPIDIEVEMQKVDPQAFLIIDCLNLWVSNLIEAGVDDSLIETRARTAVETAVQRNSPTVAVTNEVGLGIIPTNPLARRFAYVLGNVNKIWTEASEETLLLVAGRVLPLRVRPNAFEDELSNP